TSVIGEHESPSTTPESTPKQRDPSEIQRATVPIPHRTYGVQLAMKAGCFYQFCTVRTVRNWQDSILDFGPRTSDFGLQTGSSHSTRNPLSPSLANVHSYSATN